MTVIGIDISKWNGDWDAKKARAAGAHFVFIKSSQATFTDPRFLANWRKAREAGLLRGAYHYLDYTQSGVDQARYCLSLLEDDPGELPMVVDFEHPREDNNAAAARSYLKQFVEYALEQGQTPIIYTSPAFWKSYGDLSTYWYQFPLWIAHYTVASAPIVPPPWLSWKFWQFSKKGPGQLFGSEALDLDVNRFNGSLEELYELARRKPDTGTSLGERLVALETRLASLEKALQQAGLADTPPIENTDNAEGEPEPEPEEDLKQAIVIQDDTPVYLGPFTVLSAVARLKRNTPVEIIDSQSGWSKIKSPAGWVENQALKIAAETPEENEGYLVCRVSALNVRAGPGSAFPVIGWLQKGQRVRVLERSNGWAQLQSPAGWSMETYLGPL
jgi:GH25 family lysozyme M1 (1,4-beta-N-acetylmuramidase)